MVLSFYITFCSLPQWEDSFSSIGSTSLMHSASQLHRNKSIRNIRNMGLGDHYVSFLHAWFSIFIFLCTLIYLFAEKSPSLLTARGFLSYKTCVTSVMVQKHNFCLLTNTASQVFPAAMWDTASCNSPGFNRWLNSMTVIWSLAFHSVVAPLVIILWYLTHLFSLACLDPIFSELFV